MRTAFVEALCEHASKNPGVHLVVGDLGFGVLKPFMERFPDRFLNAGVAEQTMTGLATGLALSGKTVLTYSIANFPVMRCLEQIRNDVCYHGANVKIVAVGGGLVYGALGASHFATEDIAVMRSLPGMTVFAPNDPVEAAHATTAMLERPGPAYLRLGRNGEPVVHKQPIHFEVGRSICVRDGEDAAIAVTGGLLKLALEVADQLREVGINTMVLSFPTVKPLDETGLLQAAGTGAVFTLEEHSIIGGLGSAAAETLMEAGLAGVVFRRFGLPSAFPENVGNQEYLRNGLGLNAPDLTRGIQQALIENRKQR